MASAYIDFPSGTTQNARLKAFISALLTVKQNGNQIKAVFDQIALGGDWASLATALALSEEDAQQVYNLLGSVVGELNAAFIAQMLSRMG